MANDLIGWFSSNIEALILSMINGVILLLINPIIVAIGAFLSTCVNLLPDMTLQSVDMSNVLDGDLLAYINWFIPFDALGIAFTAIVTAISCHFLVYPVLRWFKLVK